MVDNSRPSTVSEQVHEEYLESLDQEDLNEHLEWAIDFWRQRNDYIETIRMHIEGRNPIALPRSKFYRAKILRARNLEGIINEKQARYLLRPEAQIIVDDVLNEEQVTNSSDIERWLRAVAYESERIGDGDVWNKALVDAHLLDTAVIKVLFNPALHYKELVAAERRSLKEIFKNPFESGSKRRKEYLMQKGTAIETGYVPLENWLPIYDGAYLRHDFEVDVKSLYNIEQSPNLDSPLLDEYDRGRYGGLDVMVPIVHFCNDLFYAYYIMPPGAPMGDNPLKIDPRNMNPSSNMSLAYVFKHGLGSNVHVPIAGRHGGWKTQNNRIEVVNKGLMDMSQAADELMSQVFTNIRATDWPTFNIQVDSEKRGYNQAGVEPKIPEITEGDNIITFIGEDIKPIVVPQGDPKVPWLMGEIRNQLGMLGGSSVLFGHRQPGVDTGYQNQQQISQAEHLDSKIEEHLAQGAIQYFTKILQYAKVFGEPLYAYYIEPLGWEGKKRGRYLELDPKKHLDPMPKIDAKVRKVRPQDYIAAARLAKELSDERQGKGPLLPDYFIRTDILARENAELDQTLIRVEAMERKALEDGSVMQMIIDATNLKVAQQTAPKAGAQQVQNADPALIQAAIQLLQNSAQAGGVDPNVLLPLLQQAVGGAGQVGGVTGGQSMQVPPSGIRHGGMLEGDSQPEARIGEEIAAAEGMK